MSAQQNGVVLHIDLTKITIDDSLKQGLGISFSAEGQTTHHYYPLSHPVTIQLNHKESNVRVSFTFNDNEIASGYLPVPHHNGPSHSCTDSLTCSLKNVYVSNTKFFAEFAIDAEYRGSALTKLADPTPQGIQTSALVGNSFSPMKSTYRGTGKLISQGETSPLRERLNPSHPTKKDQTYKYKEQELHGYLSRIVDSHM